MSWGDIMAFMLYFQKINSSFSQAISLIPLYKVSAAAADRIYDNLQKTCKKLPTSFPDNKKIPIHHSIELRDVSFFYKQKIILKQINMQFRRGKITGIFGVSGAGKSTLISLLLREIYPRTGILKLDDKFIDDYPDYKIRSSIAVLTQEPLLFQRTIKDNLIYHSPNCTAEDLMKALQLTKSEHIIQNLPVGLDTKINQNGQNLSGGERQRLCIAREILKEADVFIFDEATSALDATSEQAIIQVIHQLAKTKIIIIISHSFEIMKETDIIYVLNNGLISEQGTHEKLCKNNGLYNELFMKQKERSKNDL
jgi:ABC-type multidrug transport system fused ATPase/permease subunit